jgi:hypothetical protein
MLPHSITLPVFSLGFAQGFLVGQFARDNFGLTGIIGTLVCVAVTVVSGIAISCSEGAFVMWLLDRTNEK